MLCGCLPFEKKSKEETVAPKAMTIQDIRARGELRVGVKGDTYKFGYRDKNTGYIDGFDVDIARELAKKILGSEKQLHAVAVTTANRGELLNADELDYVIATFTITDERKLIYNFSAPYYTDKGIGMMVRKNSGIGSFQELNGRSIGVAKGTTAVKAMQKAAGELGITVKLVEYDVYPSIKAALVRGEVDAFATNHIILTSYLDDNVRLLDETLAPQSYGIVAKKGNDQLTIMANQLIKELSDNGVTKLIEEKWGL
jgi:putative glutamine transport system substrate-binding protein